MKKFEGLPREIIAMRVCKDISDGSYVNLGIGIPTLIGNWIEGRDIVLQSEIGMLKAGPLAFEEDVDQDLVNASCQPIMEMPGTAYFDICDSFTMIRGGHVDVTVMGAFQVSARGDFASWNNPDRGLGNVGNIGGSMDLAAGASNLFIAMEHTTSQGEKKIVETLTYPATGVCKVKKIFTDLAVIQVTPQGLVLEEYFPGVTPDEIQSVTGAKLIFSPDLREIEL
ncbi:CoA-transferase [Desulfotignum balticum]|uniref:CoA-transferase n=1 Tax=Desulfotignum balticum TaxID=115781 RepID=UPI0003F784DC|nr:CoA-transferase [Desulfotignum balticum]